MQLDFYAYVLADGYDGCGVAVGPQERDAVFNRDALHIIGCFLDREESTLRRCLQNPRFLFSGRHCADHFLSPMELSPVNVLEHVVQGLLSQVLFLNSREKPNRQVASNDRHWFLVHKPETSQTICLLIRSELEGLRRFRIPDLRVREPGPWPTASGHAAAW
jgi:hypothetical protein